jgi:primosomal protein N' (replication factor Y)
VNNTKHPVLQFVKEHDYQKLFDYEIENRRNFFYPPFSRTILLTFKHRQKHLAEEAANIMSQFLTRSYSKYLSGPAEPVVNRVRNQYLFELLLKLPKDTQLILQCKRDILQQEAIIQTNKRYRTVVVIADVDPV